MGTKINLENQTDSTEFVDKVEDAIVGTGNAKDAISDFVEFNTVSGHDHDGSDAKNVDWSNIANAPTSLMPDAHAHGTVASSIFHSPMTPNDHHIMLSTGYDIEPQSITLTPDSPPGTRHLTAPDGSFIRLGDTSLGVQMYYDGASELRLANWGSGGSDFRIISDIDNTYIDSPSIHIGTDTSTVDFKKADVAGDFWSVTGGTGVATFATINNVIIATTGITNVVKFNGVTLNAAGTHSTLTVGNATYQINHSTHQQHTDTGTSSSTFNIDTGGNPIIISSNAYSAPSTSQSALYNDISSEQALVIAGNASSGPKYVKIKDKLEVVDDVIINGTAFAQTNRRLATISPAGDIRDNYVSGWIQVGYVKFQWGTSGAVTGWRSVSFTQAFSGAPSVSVSCSDSSGSDWRTKNISATGFDIKSVNDTGSDVSAELNWMAIGN